jgi:chromosome segregation ATPase
VEKGISEAEALAGEKKSLAEKAESRLGEALKTAEPLESILKRSAARAKPAETRTAQQISNLEKRLSELDKESASVASKAAKSAESQKAVEQEFASLLNDLSKPVTKARDVPGMVTKLADRLLSLNHITQEERNRLVNLAAKNSDLFADTTTARRVFGAMAVAIGIPALGLKFYDPRSAAGL